MRVTVREARRRAWGSPGQRRAIEWARRAALSNLGAIMGRAAVHTGKVVTWEQAMASKFQFCSNVDSLTAS